MAGKSRASFAKRQREIDRQKKNAEKRQRRAERNAERAEEDEDVPAGEPTEEELFEQFRILNERKAAGAIEDEEFEEQKAELFEKLGLPVD